MNGSSGEPATMLQARVECLARYAEVALAQLEALETGDLEALAHLADRRDELAAEVDAGPPLMDLLEANEVAGDDAGLLERMRAELARAAEVSQLVNERLRAMRREVLGEIDELERRERALRQYLESDGSAVPSLDSRL